MFALVYPKIKKSSFPKTFNDDYNDGDFCFFFCKQKQTNKFPIDKGLIDDWVFYFIFLFIARRRLCRPKQLIGKEMLRSDSRFSRSLSLSLSLFIYVTNYLSCQ